nr:MAG TPA: hypothetical protein [Caudoviricetes sp.]
MQGYLYATRLARQQGRTYQALHRYRNRVTYNVRNRKVINITK